MTATMTAGARKNRTHTPRRDRGDSSPRASRTASRPTADPHAPDRAEYPIVRIRLEQIAPNPHNPRQEFDEEQLRSLATSLQETTLVHPINVRPLGPNRYEVINGERRYRAAQLAGWGTIPAVVRDVSQQTALEMMVAENLERESLNLIEKARALELLTKPIDEGGAGLRVMEVARKLSVSHTYVSEHITLLRLPDEWREKVVTRKLALRTARQLARLSDRPEALAACERDMEDHPADWATGDVAAITAAAIVKCFDQAATAAAEPAGTADSGDDPGPAAAPNPVPRATAPRSRPVSHIVAPDPEPAADAPLTAEEPSAATSGQVLARILPLVRQVIELEDIEELAKAVEVQRRAVLAREMQARVRGSLQKPHAR